MYYDIYNDVIYTIKTVIISLDKKKCDAMCG